MKKIILFLLLATSVFAQFDSSSFKIAKPKRNFIYSNQENDASLVFSYNSEKPINGVLVDRSSNYKNGTISKAIYAGGVEGGLSLNSTSPSLITIGNIGSIKTLALRIKLNSTTEKIIEGYSNGSLIYASSGTLTQPFTNSYVNGVSSSTVTANNIFTLVLTNATAIDFTNFKIGVNNATYGSFTIYDIRAYTSEWTLQRAKDYHNKFARQVYLYEDFSDYGVGTFPREWNKVSGTFAIAQLTADIGNLKKNDKYLNCSSAGSVYMSGNTNIGSYYMTYEYYTGGAWTSKSGTVSALSTAEATFDYSANGRLTFIMGTNDRVAKIKIQKGAIVQ